jgi:type IV pilus biogenesis protein PilP
MSSRKFLALAACMVAALATQFANAQTTKVDDKATPATIGEITRLSRELMVENLKKELREAKKAGIDAPVSMLPAAGSGNGIAAPRLPALPPPEPKPPMVSSIYGVGSGAMALVATTGDGQTLRVGDRTGEWKVVGINERKVSFERCTSTTKGKGTKAVTTESCKTVASAP